MTAPTVNITESTINAAPVIKLDTARDLAAALRANAEAIKVLASALDQPSYGVFVEGDHTVTNNNYHPSDD